MIVSALAVKTPLPGRFLLGAQLYAVLMLLLMGASWLVPVHFLPWVSWHSEFLAFLSMFLLAWFGLVQQLRQGGGSDVVAVPGAAFVFMGLALIAIVQALTGLINFSGDALIFNLYMVLCAMGLTLGFTAGKHLQRPAPRLVICDGQTALMALAATLLTGGVASVIVAFVQVMDVWDGVSWIARMPQLRRPGGNMGQPNQLATLILMGLASLIFLYESSKLSTWSGTLIFIVLGSGLAVTESRTGVLSIVVLSVWWFVSRARVSFRLSPWVVAMAVIGCLLMFLAWPAIEGLIQGMDAGADVGVNTKAGTRLIVWPQLLDALAMQPWWGWGIHQVAAAHNAVVHAYPVSEPFSYSHNIVLDLALGVGLPMAIFLVLLISVWLWRRVRSVQALTPWYCLAAVLPVAVHSMLEFPFTYAYFLVPVMLLLGTLEATSGVRPWLHVGARTAAVALLLLSVLGLWSVVEYLNIEEDFRVARFESMRIGQTPTAYERPQVHLLTQLGALLEDARIIPKPGMSTSELELAKKVALRYPWPATQNRYALSLALNGNPEEAIRQMRVMRAMHGEKTYSEIKQNWITLGQDKYPRMKELQLP